MYQYFGGALSTPAKKMVTGTLLGDTLSFSNYIANIANYESKSVSM